MGNFIARVNDMKLKTIRSLPSPASYAPLSYVLGNRKPLLIRLCIKVSRVMCAWFYSLLSLVHPYKKGCGQCASRIPDVGARFKGLPEPCFPVDAIITWVDGSDLEYQKKIQKEHKALYPNKPIEVGRYRDNGELRYALHSLEAYAPWLRAIHLVTDGQRPSWLKKAHPKLRVVDHKDFIPAEYLPTFNSHVIEAFLRQISDLAEHYIYFNDDVFLGRMTRKSDFFTANGLPFCFVDWRPLREFGYGWRSSPHSSSWRNALNHIQEEGASELDHSFIAAHGPFPQTVTNARDAFAFYEQLIMNFAANRFRTNDEVAFYCHAAPMWLYEQKRTILCDERYYYVQNGQIDRDAYYTALLNSKNDMAPPLFFCINDTGSSPFTPWQRKDLRKVLYSYFRDISGTNGKGGEL